MIEQGFDTQINEVSAWSTLGFFNDPILSSMLYRDDGSLANLIIHEMTHGTIFIKNNLELNENLASFVGEYGAVKFLEHKYGKESEQLKKYFFQHRFRNAYSNHLLSGTKELDSLYKTFEKHQLPTTLKDSLKTITIQKIMSSTDTLLGGTLKKYNRPKNKKLPNNAFFVGYLTYHSQQNEFKQEFETKFKSNFQLYLAYLKQKYPTSF